MREVPEDCISGKPAGAAGLEMLNKRYTVYVAVIGQRNTCGPTNSREVIDAGNRLVTDRARLYHARPANNHGYADTTFIRIALSGTQWGVIGDTRKTAIVTGEDNESILCEIKLVEEYSL